MVQQIIPSHLGLSLSAGKTHTGFVSDWMGLLRVTFTPAVAPTMLGMEHCPAHSCHTHAIFLFLIRMLSVPLEPQNKTQPNTTLLGIHCNTGKKYFNLNVKIEL